MVVDEIAKKSLNRHAGLDPASRMDLIYWMPAFAGMTERGKRFLSFDPFRHRGNNLNGFYILPDVVRCVTHVQLLE